MVSVVFCCFPLFLLSLVGFHCFYSQSLLFFKFFRIFCCFKISTIRISVVNRLFATDNTYLLPCILLMPDIIYLFFIFSLFSFCGPDIPLCTLSVSTWYAVYSVVVYFCSLRVLPIFYVVSCPLMYNNVTWYVVLLRIFFFHLIFFLTYWFFIVLFL